MRKLSLIIRIEFSVKDEIAMCNEGQVRKVHAMQRSNEISRWKISMRCGFVCDVLMGVEVLEEGAGKERERERERDSIYPPLMSVSKIAMTVFFSNLPPWSQ